MTAAPVALAAGGGVDAAQQTKASGAFRSAADAGPHPGTASSLAEEERIARLDDAQAISPGRFKTASGTAARLYADAPAVQLDGVRETRSQFTKAQLDALTRRLRAAAGQPGVSYGFYYDAASDRVRVDGDVDASQLPADARAQGKVVLRRAPASRQTRAQDTAPHWGGASITSGGAGCTGAFIVKNASNTRFAVTAGHCGGIGSVWKTGVHVYGNMTSKAPFPTRDMALLSGAYGTQIYMGGAVGFGTAVAGAGDPVVGASYCTSGAQSFENCGKVVNSLNATFCDPAGCTGGLISYTGGALTLNGDSGAPLVMKSGSTVLVRGLHIALAGTTMYAEKWSRVAAQFGISIVTG